MMEPVGHLDPVHGVDPADAELTAAVSAWMVDAKLEGELHYDAVAFPGLERALLGIGEQWGGNRLLVYGVDEIVAELRRQNGWDDEEAWEWYHHNIECVFAGPGTPLMLQRLDLVELAQEYRRR